MNTNEKKEITIRIAKEEDAEELLAMMCRRWKNSEDGSGMYWRDIHILWRR